MFTTVSFLYLGAFILWMNTSQRLAWTEKSDVFTYLATHTWYCRLLSVGLLVVAGLLSVYLLGIGSGIFAAFVWLMAAGSVAVLLFPFRYFGLKALFLTYALLVTLEVLSA